MNRSPDDPSPQIRDLALARFVEQYAEQSAVWHGLDGKAQGTVAIAGIFVASAFAFVEQADTGLPAYQCLLVSLSVLALLTSIALCVATLLVRKSARPPDARAMLSTASDCANLDPEERAEMFPEIIASLGREWEIAHRHVALVNRRKAHFLFWAQVSLSTALLAVAAMTIIQVWW